MDSYISLLRGRVLPRDSESEVIFRITEEDGVAAPDLIARLGGEIFAGRLDVTLCYCSVYDDCWTSSLREVMKRSSAIAPPSAERPVESCDRAPRSAI